MIKNCILAPQSINAIASLTSTHPIFKIRLLFPRCPLCILITFTSAHQRDITPDRYCINTPYGRNFYRQNHSTLKKTRCRDYMQLEQSVIELLPSDCHHKYCVLSKNTDICSCCGSAWQDWDRVDAILPPSLLVSSLLGQSPLPSPSWILKARRC